VQCIQYTYDHAKSQQSHYRRLISNPEGIDLEYLKHLFTNGSEHCEECHVVEQKITRRRFCGIISQNRSRMDLKLITTIGADHPQGQGSLESMPCKVQFNFIVPDDLHTTPYIILSSHGRHLHPPPPPSKAPHILMNGVIDVINRLQSPALTLCKTDSKLILD
jgi:hypothetical protein